MARINDFASFGAYFWGRRIIRTLEASHSIIESKIIFIFWYQLAKKMQNRTCSLCSMSCRVKNWPWVRIGTWNFCNACNGTRNRMCHGVESRLPVINRMFIFYEHQIFCLCSCQIKTWRPDNHAESNADSYVPLQRSRETEDLRQLDMIYDNWLWILQLADTMK